MALESNAWLATSSTAGRDQQQHAGAAKPREDPALGPVAQQSFAAGGTAAGEDAAQGQQRGLLKIPSSAGKCSMFTQTEHTNRFTQTEHPTTRYAGNCLENNSNAVSCKTDSSAMFDPSTMQQPQQQPQQQQQQQSTNTQIYAANNSDAKPKDGDKSANTVEFPFCYNVNMLQKVHQQQGAAGVPVAGITGDDKGCYRFDVAQPFTYNYALVNQMSLAAAASTATFKCDVCGLVFSHLSLLNHHKRVHTAGGAERQHTCDLCGACFNLAGELKSHKTSVHGKNAQNHNHVKCCDSCGVELTGCEHQMVAGKGKKGKFIKCETCMEMSAGGAGNSSNGSVGNGAFSGSSSGGEGNSNNSPPVVGIKPGHHPVKRRGIASVTKCHKCNGSGLIFIGGTRNTTAVDKPFHCNVCDGTFSRYSSLWSHKRLHSGDKPFKCEICGLAFAKAAYLKNHCRVHTGEKPFKCAVCGMQFSQSPHLKNHERIHSGERPYQCEVCDKTFARHSTLWNHRRIHTGEKPYRCEVCGSAFNQATHLKNHAKVHTGEKPHRCDVCEVGFADRFALKRHRGIHEKYGRTGPNVPSSAANTAGPAGNQGPANGSSQQAGNPSNAPQQTTMEELYKCEVGGPIAFPGCSRPHDDKQ
ncbi:zinc finger protein 227-like isoform X2 [Bacillus rossius redtenbacheri]